MDVTSMAMPDIAGLSVEMAQNKLQTELGTAILAKSLDAFEADSAAMVKAMELSVDPGLGSGIDVSV